MTQLYSHNADRKLLILRQSIIYSLGLAKNFLPAHSRIVEKLDALFVEVENEIRFRNVREPVVPDGAA